jgi:catechol 2,3-dioxygenase-like lactoylglutathione lyase family enzyme
VRRAAFPLLLAVAIPTPASITGQTNATPFTTSGAFVALSVADLPASSQWYRDKLGLRVVLEPPRSGDAAVTILEGGGLIVELLQHKAAKPLSAISSTVRESYAVHGIFKAGLIVDDFDRTISTLRSRGVQIAYGPFPKSATQRANAIIRDNAGNLIQFFGR